MPDYIGADMGSTDIGPYYLGKGEIDGHRQIVFRDLEMVLLAGRRLDVPVLVGTAGSAGGKPHVDKTLDVLFEIAQKHRLSFRLAIIHAEVDKSYLTAKLAEGRVSPCGPVPALTQGSIDKATRLVGQMGVEPFVAALEGGADVVVAGRACDAAIFSAVPIMRGYDIGLAMHMAKIIECSSLCAEPGGRDAIMAFLSKDHFILESMNPERHSTPASVAAHSLYEQPRADGFSEPGGKVDISEVRYESEGNHRTKVSGSKWIPSLPYSIKIEGVEHVGYRYISMGAMRCPIAVREIRTILMRVQEIVDELLEGSVDPADYHLQFRPYGIHGAMGDGEVACDPRPIEIMVMTDVVASSPQIAQSVCSVARYNLLHYFYDGILATGGNLAMPFAPSDIFAGDVFEFTVYHLVEVDDPLELFKIDFVNVEEGVRCGETT